MIMRQLCLVVIIKSPQSHQVCKYIHTVIFEYFNIKEYALSNFALQSFKIFIGT